MKPNSPENIRALEAMSTENLEALLRAEMESDREVNVELIDAVCAVLDERTESEPVDVDAAWNSFLHNHLTTEPLYSTPEEAPKKKVIRKKRWKRLGIAAALLATYLLGATMSANAVGYTLMDTVVIWPSETFGFSFDQSSNTSSIVTNPEYTELKTALALADISSPVSYTHLDVYKRQGRRNGTAWRCCRTARTWGA